MRHAAFRQAVPRMQSLDDEELPEQAAPDAGLDDKVDVVKALARLAPIHREVLVLLYFDSMPTAQMAEALKIAPGTVLSRLARARDALKLAMGVPLKLQPGASVSPLRRTKDMKPELHIVQPRRGCAVGVGHQFH